MTCLLCLALFHNHLSNLYLSKGGPGNKAQAEPTPGQENTTETAASGKGAHAHKHGTYRHFTWSFHSFLVAGAKITERNQI